MGIGSALVLIALGAILAFATHFHVSGIDVQMIGWILIFVGIAMLVITLAYTRPRARRRAAVVRDVDVIDGEPQPGAYMRGPEEEPTVVEPVDGAGHAQVRRTVHERRDIR
ncbi:DUF6458 family protein [Actinoallomurus iriomotensis]|uniref:DUF6458 domain-containing protein n=1 Tax=Actinoallomurus iriomotensis TaxID=478107 RepID=A0A9W6RLR5_9ACTN|nr:DUF6458 family protein [Actinoallomurus iriomotensis]GLY78256.1 hypothetical protein Airi01_065230 [Actinoallomurus iriomotensis]